MAAEWRRETRRVRRTVKAVNFPTEPPERRDLTEEERRAYLRETRLSRKTGDVKAILGRLPLSSEARKVIFGGERVAGAGSHTRHD